jgi:hypothetical protein
MYTRQLRSAIYIRPNCSTVYYSNMCGNRTFLHRRLDFCPVEYNVNIYINCPSQRAGTILVSAKEQRRGEGPRRSGARIYQCQERKGSGPAGLEEGRRGHERRWRRESNVGPGPGNVEEGEGEEAPGEMEEASREVGKGRSRILLLRSSPSAKIADKLIVSLKSSTI